MSESKFSKGLLEAIARVEKREANFRNRNTRKQQEVKDGPVEVLPLSVEQQAVAEQKLAEYHQSKAESRAALIRAGIVTPRVAGVQHGSRAADIIRIGLGMDYLPVQPDRLPTIKVRDRAGFEKELVPVRELPAFEDEERTYRGINERDGYADQDS